MTRSIRHSVRILAVSAVCAALAATSAAPGQPTVDQQPLEFEGVGEIEFNAHDSWYQQPGIRHEVLQYSDDFTVLEMNIPAEFPTIDVDRKTGAESVYG